LKNPRLRSRFQEVAILEIEHQARPIPPRNGCEQCGLIIAVFARFTADNRKARRACAKWRAGREEANAIGRLKARVDIVDFLEKFLVDCADAASRV
jgi:hypothetical protein